MNQRPDPQKYSMYAAFRTRERGEKKAREKRESIYDLNRPRRSTAQSAQARTPEPSAGIYRVSRTPQRPTQPTQTADLGAQPRSAQEIRAQQARRAGQAAQHKQAGTYGTSLQRDTARRQIPADKGATPARTGVQSTSQADIARAKKQQQQKQGSAARTPQKQLTVGTRVPSKGEEAFRYGFHSSYRTSDGRILDGFDKTGRPIYRESGGAAVVRHVGSDVDVARLHPVRRIRVETLVDTKKKPFPFMLVLTMVFCTALVMGVLYSYMRLNECTNTLSTLNYRLSALRNETNTLTAEVVRREDLIAIEHTAADTLGMVKNDVLTKRYVSIENEDKTEIFDNNMEVKDEHEIVEIDMKTGNILITAEEETSETENSAG